MAVNIKSRWSAFGLHFAISVIILIALLAVIFFVWFPYDLIYAGGITGLKIVMGVDLVLGPLLTLVVFAPGKKSLKFDLSMIALLQAGCLFAGMWLVFNERPLVQVLADDGVHLLAASDFSYYQLDLPELPGRSPKNVMLDLPEDRGALGSIKLTSEMMDEKPFVFRTDLYLPVTQVSRERFQQRIEFIQEPFVQEPSVQDPAVQNPPVDQEFKALPVNEKEPCFWVPLHSKHYYGYACTNHTNGIIKLAARTPEDGV